MEDFTSVQDFEDYALKSLSPAVKHFYLGPKTAQLTTKLNMDTFGKLRIRPKLLRNVSERDISTTILGETISMPLGISPTAVQKPAHVDGECATAKAAEIMGTIFVLSSFSNHTIQEVAKAAPKAIKWQQLTMNKDQDFTRYIVQTAEQAGFKGIVVTADFPVVTKSKVTTSIVHDNITFAIYKEFYLSKYSEDKLDGLYSWAIENVADFITWQDISWLRSITKLPIIVKGILTAEEALTAVDHGASAIIVSNHGGRQLPSVPATIEVLPEIVAAVGNKVEVYLDGGIRAGTDVFKALALGAKMVLVGRPMLWGLACGGEKGARAVLETLRSEIDETFALTGCSNVQEVTKDLVRHESLYSHL